MQLRIQAKPNSAKDELLRETDGTLKVKLRALPVEGKANKALVEFMSEVLQLPKSKIEVQKGGASRFKTLLIDAEEEAVLAKVNAALKEP